LLGFAEHDIPVLIKARLLKPLGSPAQNGIKWFSTAELEALAQDRAWLDRATKAVQSHWRVRNREKNLGPVSEGRPVGFGDQGNEQA
jgi:hypothetical protein